MPNTINDTQLIADVIFSYTGHPVQYVSIPKNHMKAKEIHTTARNDSIVKTSNLFFDSSKAYNQAIVA